MIARSRFDGTGPDERTAIIRDAGHCSAGPGPDFMDVSTLAGDQVVNVVGNELGTIEAIMLDVAAGRVAYAVLSFDDRRSGPRKLFAIPWSVLTLDAKAKRFILDVTEAQLDSAPGFDADHWPRMADREWAIQLHAYYDEEPYWDDPLSASSG